MVILLEDFILKIEITEVTHACGKLQRLQKCEVEPCLSLPGRSVGSPQAASSPGHRPLTPRLPFEGFQRRPLVPGLPGLERLVRPPAGHSLVHEVIFPTSGAWPCWVPGHLLMQEVAGRGASHEGDPRPGGWPGSLAEDGLASLGAALSGPRHRERPCVLGAGGPLPTAVVTSTGGAGARLTLLNIWEPNFSYSPVVLQLIRPASCSNRDVVSGGQPSF